MCRLLFVSLLSIALMGGCAARLAVIASDDPIGSPPEDFSIDLTVLTAVSTHRQPAEVHLRPSRFVLFPDGSLHYGVDEVRGGRGANWLPGLTRRLSREQMSQIWSLTRELGFANPERGDPPVNFGLIEPQSGLVKYLAAFSAHDRRWTFTRTSPLDDPDAAMVELARALGHFAWASDRPAASVRTGRTRYDFGPDPYARFR